MAVTRKTLTRLVETLPSEYYYDPDHYERELDAFWYRHWICVGSSAAVAAPRSFRVVELGDQSIVITRDEASQLHAFHNTCRHRGSILCEHVSGQFNGGRIVCPYHAWTYTLEGELERTPRRLPSDDFDFANFPLYRVGVSEWAGFLFINLDEQHTASAQQALGNVPALFENWKLDDTTVGHHMHVDLDCNWKVFWENFDECYHCPGVHPELCQVIPLYGNGWVSVTDNPDWQPDEQASASPEPRLAPDARTWSMDGGSVAPEFEHLTEQQRRAGHTYGVSPPSCFMVAHVDYARMVYLLPLGPEKTRLDVTWLLNPLTAADPNARIEDIIALGKLVVEQDGRACELNQRGLRSRRFGSGVLVPQEYHIADFHDWIRAGLKLD